MIVSQSDFFIGLMVFVRMGVMMALIPVFAGKVIPTQVRLALALGLSWILFPLLIENVQIPEHFLGFALAIVRELLVGLLMGFAVRILFHVAEFAGALISIDASLMRSDVFDPFSQAKTTTVGTVLFHLSALLLFITGTHYHMIESFVFSYQKVPLGLIIPEIMSIDVLVKTSAQVFLLGLKIAAPIVALSFVINMTFAVLGKAVPRMNVFMVSFAVRIFAGLSLLLLIIGLVVQYLYQYIEHIPKKMLEFLAF